MNLVKHRNLFFLISAIVIVPGLIALVLFGLRLSIEFTGGSELEMSISNPNPAKIKQVIEADNVKVHTVNITGQKILVRTAPLSQDQKKEVVASVEKVYPKAKEKSFETIGPTIGKETGINALKAVVVASIAITAYIAFAFRKVSEPVSSWKYGVCAILALLHDVLVVVGIFAILGYLFDVEIDSLFITALLTIMGFSVHDTIVVFDRIRENLRKNYSHEFEEVVNKSLLETMNRSVNTSLTVLLVLFALLLFGGESIRWFVVALLAGIISGTYSSIFNASQLLVVWYEFDKRRKLNKKSKTK
ncbi:MAG TPA: protein translocase subunit SecF [Patescibacteria group bacterium]|nr:protein translocase subunit SecF [Patescibacteria group bacterium]